MADLTCVYARVIICIILLVNILSCGGGSSGGPSAVNERPRDNEEPELPMVDDETGPPPPAVDDEMDPPPPGPGEVVIIPIDPSEVEYAQHYDPRALVSVQYPRHWDKEYAGTEDIAHFLDDGSGLAILQKITPDDVGGELPDGEPLDFEIISERPIEVAGIEGFEQIVEIDFSTEGKFRVLSSLFEFNESVYIFTYGAERSDFLKNVELARRMAQSIRIGHAAIENTNTTSENEVPGKPAIASDGENFLVISCRESDIRFRDVLVGRIIGRSGTGEEFIIYPIRNPPTSEECPKLNYDVIYDGLNYLVTYSASPDFGATISVYGRRISRTGEMLDPDPVNISRNPAGTAAEDPVSAFDGDRTLVVWRNHVNVTGAFCIKGAFFSPGGDVSGDFPIECDLEDQFFPLPLGFYRLIPQVAYGDNQYLVIWAPYFFQDTDSDQTYPIYGQLLDLSGVPQLPAAVEIRSDPGTTPRYHQVASDGENYLVSWIEGELETNYISEGSFTVYARKLSASGELLNGAAADTGFEVAPILPDTEPDAVDGEQIPKDFLDLSYHDGNYVFLWSSLIHGIHHAVVSGDLEIVSPARPLVGTRSDAFFSSDLRVVTLPNIAFGDEQALVAWPAQRYGMVEGWFFNNSDF